MMRTHAMVLLLLWGTALSGCGDGHGRDAVCGDGIQQTGEACDGEDLANTTCASLGFTGDDLGCGENCRFDVRTCVGCGNQAVDAGEECDGTELDGQTCGDLGFEGGMLTCSDDCTLRLAYCDGGCGNDVQEVGEDCDGTDLGALTCGVLGHHDGAVACAPDCTPDTAGCGPALMPLGSGCTNDASCLSGSCLTEPEHGLPAGTCTEPCRNLGEGLVCLSTDALCACVDPDCLQRSCLTQCTPGSPNQCRPGYGCVDQGEGYGACQPRCTDDAQCVVTHTCDDTGGSPTLGYCRVPSELCGNAIDDDLDGRADCADNDCNASCPAGEICTNGGDDDGDGLTDCDDGECLWHTHCTGISCTATGPLPTDATLLGESNAQTGSASNMDDWCGSASHLWTGPELIYSLTVTANVRVTVALVDVTADVDLLVLTDGTTWGDCNPRACLTQSTSVGLTDEEVTFDARPGRSYWVVVDGWQSAVATYDLRVTTAPGEICDNGLDEDDDGLVDCADPSCFSDTACTTELDCADTLDNDQDGDVDCADADCSATPWCQATPILTEDFSTWPPAGWVVQDGGLDGFTWQQCTVCPESLATAAGSYAVVSSDLAGPARPLDESLVTPPMDLSTHSAVWLSFTHHFKDLAPANQSDFGLVEVSLDATHWTPIQFWSTTTPARTELVDLSAPLAGQPVAYVRFHYVDGNAWAWYWAIDSVTIKAN